MTLIIVLVVVSLVAVWLDRRWQARQVSPTEEPAATATWSDWFKGLGSRFRRNKKAELAQQFQDWAKQSLEKEAGLRNWLTALSPEGIKALTEQLNAFCADLNVSLWWLVEQQLDSDPELKQKVEEIVVSYCRACWNAAQMQQELQVFETYHAFMQNPTHRKYREFSQDLYAKLVEAGLVESPRLSEVLLASTKKRQAYITKAIQEVAEKDRQAFNRVLEAVVAAEDENGSGGEAAPDSEPAKTQSTQPQAASAGSNA